MWASDGRLFLGQLEPESPAPLKPGTLMFHDRSVGREGKEMWGERRREMWREGRRELREMWREGRRELREMWGEGKKGAKKGGKGERFLTKVQLQVFGLQSTGLPMCCQLA